jgi:uncharacterized protein (DUF1501 family)
MLSRRNFLGTSSLFALTPTIPAFLGALARAATPEREARILIVIELNGGNDGLNTVVPFSDEGYAKYRKVLRLPSDRLLKVTKEVALHPAMTEVTKLLESGQLAIIQGVSYPNPIRSHFKSMAIWQSANVELPRTDTLDTETEAVYGWIGQALDKDRKPADGAPAAQFIGSGSMPAALRSRGSLASCVSRLQDSVLLLKGSAQTVVAETGRKGDLVTFVNRSMLDAYATSERLGAVLGKEDQSGFYPTTNLAAQLRVVSRMIKAGIGTRVYYVSQSGYDTHTFQLPTHADLLGEFSGALKAFLDDLAGAKLAERVAVLCFSEFGRRVAENSSHGTDHGTAGTVFLAGPRVKAGLVGATQSLTDLDENGDLKMVIDFRRVYATVVNEWLGLDGKIVLGGDYEGLTLFRD